MNVAVTALIRVASAAAIARTAFGKVSIKRLFLNTGAFLIANLLLAGAVQAAESWLKPGFICTGNSFFYVDFSLLLLLAVTALLYFAVCFAGKLSGCTAKGEWTVVIRYRGKIVRLEGLADTGNLLTDFFTGLPVVICGREVYSELTGGELSEEIVPDGMRLIPCSTVSESGLMPIMRPDELIIICGENGERKSAGALVGFGNCGRRAVFNPELIKY